MCFNRTRRRIRLHGLVPFPPLSFKLPCVFFQGLAASLCSSLKSRMKRTSCYEPNSELNSSYGYRNRRASISIEVFGHESVSHCFGSAQLPKCPILLHSGKSLYWACVFIMPPSFTLGMVTIALVRNDGQHPWHKASGMLGQSGFALLKRRSTQNLLRL